MIDPLVQFDAAARLAAKDVGAGLAGCGLGVFHRNTRLFLRGDLVIVWFTNGQAERWPVYGRSSRGYDVVGLYQQGARFRDRGTFVRTVTHEGKPLAYRSSTGDCHNNKTPMRLVDVPRELLTSRSEADSGRLRRWLSEALRTGHPAGEVGSGSLALPFYDGSSPRARRKQRVPPDVQW